MSLLTYYHCNPSPHQERLRSLHGIGAIVISPSNFKWYAEVNTLGFTLKSRCWI